VRIECDVWGQLTTVGSCGGVCVYVCVCVGGGGVQHENLCRALKHLGVEGVSCGTSAVFVFSGVGWGGSCCRAAGAWHAGCSG
jgi:hypothetical protein